MQNEVDFSSVDKLSEALTEYGNNAGKVIDEYLHDEGFERIASHIPDLIHASGRRWRGKATSATSAGYSSVFDRTVASMTLTVSTQNRYGYLYFPDDGSNSRRHAGNQRFMIRAVEDRQDEVVDEIVERLVTAFEEG